MRDQHLFDLVLIKCDQPPLVKFTFGNNLLPIQAEIRCKQLGQAKFEEVVDGRYFRSVIRFFEHRAPSQGPVRLVINNVYIEVIQCSETGGVNQVNMVMYDNSENTIRDRGHMFERPTKYGRFQIPQDVLSCIQSEDNIRDAHVRFTREGVMSIPIHSGATHIKTKVMAEGDGFRMKIHYPMFLAVLKAIDFPCTLSYFGHYITLESQFVSISCVLVDDEDAN